jgi:hypothetical protein
MQWSCVANSPYSLEQNTEIPVFEGEEEENSMRSLLVVEDVFYLL